MPLHPNILAASIANNKKFRDDAIARYMVRPKKCLQCNSILLVKDNECPGCTRKRNFCGHSCAAQYNNRGRIRPLKKCLLCGKEFKHNSNRWPAMCCSAKCRKEYGYKTYIERWLAGKESGNVGNGRGLQLSQHIRRWLEENYGRKCSRCGWSEINPNTKKVPVTIDHIDGNPYHTTPGNIRFLCPNCHSLTPYYGGANKGRGRERSEHRAR